MKKWQSRILLVILSGLILIPGLAWSFMPMLAPPMGLHPTSWNDADLIRDRTTLCLVDPDKMEKSEDGVLFGWMLLEMKVRTVTTFSFWGAVLTGVFINGKRKRSLNNELESIVA